MAKVEQAEPAGLIAKLRIDPDTDLAKWIQQQHDAGVRDIDILTTIADAGELTPAKFKRVPLE